MAKTLSQMLPLGTIAPDFTLLDTVSGENKSLQNLKSPIATVIMFICNHCPYVKHIETTLVKVAKKYQTLGVQFIAINSNDAENYPQDGPGPMRENALRLGFNFPYLFDESQEIAKAYHAACTPDFFIFDADLACVYRGQFDASRPNNGIEVSGESLTKALDAIISHQEISANQEPSLGCNIKWKS